jgi:hypothetical protein
LRTVTRTKIFNASAEDVFKNLDDLGVTGTHMTNSSAMMMGSKLELTYLTSHHIGRGSKYRWTGKMMGIPMDFTVVVTKWIMDKEKIWETVGDSKLIIYSWYRMMLKIEPVSNGTRATLSIGYRRPQSFILKIISLLFADLYCIWCLKKMLGDATRHLAHPVRTAPI